MLEIVRETPWWVFALLAYLMVVGIRALKPITISIKKMGMLLPALLIILGCGVYGFAMRYGPDLGKVLVGIFSFIIGGICGWRWGIRSKTQIDHAHKKITLPGSPLPLLLILLIFSVKYFFGYTFATNPTAQEDIFLVFGDLVATTGVAGIFLGRFLGFFRSLRKSDFL